MDKTIGTQGIKYMLEAWCVLHEPSRASVSRVGEFERCIVFVS